MGIFSITLVIKQHPVPDIFRNIPQGLGFDMEVFFYHYWIRNHCPPLGDWHCRLANLVQPITNHGIVTVYKLPLCGLAGTIPLFLVSRADNDRLLG